MYFFDQFLIDSFITKLLKHLINFKNYEFFKITIFLKIKFLEALNNILN